MTDRELLELAAKAAGLWEDTFMLDDEWQPIWDEPHGFLLGWGEGIWNPLTDDGDALRLAVKSGLSFDRYFTGYDEVVCGDFRRTPLVICPEPVNDDPYAATRRAIVRAAAEIGKEQK